VQEKEPNHSTLPTGDSTLEEIRSIFYRDLAARAPSSLSLEAHIVASHAHNLEKLESPARYRTPLWEFGRAMMPHPAIADISPDEALDVLEESFCGWVSHLNGSAPSSRRRKVLGGVDGVWLWLFRDLHLQRGVPAIASAEDGRVEFVNTLEVARFGAGADPLDCAFNLARRHRLEPRVGTKRLNEYAMFVSIAGWLQNIMGDRPIGLPESRIGDMLKVESITISRYRKRAMRAGLLEKVEDHHFGGKPGLGRATTFRFDVSRFPVLTEGRLNG